MTGEESGFEIEGLHNCDIGSNSSITIESEQIFAASFSSGPRFSDHYP